MPKIYYKVVFETSICSIKKMYKTLESSCLNTIFLLGPFEHVLNYAK